MSRAIHPESLPSPAAPPRTPAHRLLAEGAGWSVREFICTLGPEDRPYEEYHDRFAISAVVQGSFQYRSAAGTALLYPGSFLLGNAGSCFECGHEHGVGDRCMAVHLEAELFEEIAASAAGTSRYRFAAAMLPALRSLLPTFARVESMGSVADRSALEELVFALAEQVLATMSGHAPAAASVAAKDARRVSQVVRHMEEHAERPLDLDALAEMACMSKYHFLRAFRRRLGVTPHQLLLGLRLRRAAQALRATSLPVATVAFDAGFGDLSTFNAHFRQFFGKTPRSYRQEQRGR